MNSLRVTLVAVLASVVPGLGHAQQTPPQAYAGLSFQVGQARGQFADYVDFGWGGGGYVVSILFFELFCASFALVVAGITMYS